MEQPQTLMPSYSVHADVRFIDNSHNNNNNINNNSNNYGSEPTKFTTSNIIPLALIDKLIIINYYNYIAVNIIIIVSSFLNLNLLNSFKQID